MAKGIQPEICFFLMGKLLQEPGASPAGYSITDAD
jgi:hypothetical protein